MTAPYLTILGTGNALATRCYNTCFTLYDPSGEILLVDAGGGNGILTQIERAQIDLRSIHNLFITHTHTDHLLGAVWVMRMALQFGYPLHVWSHSKALELLTDICWRMLPEKEAEALHARTLILYHTEDRTLASRRERYTAEAQSVFSGAVLVPDDLERIEL